MTDIQKRFLELERKYKEYKQYREDLQQAIEDVIKEQGLNSYFQDEQGTVYKFVECCGRWVTFDKYAYNRTRRDGEKTATLSLKEAAEKGFKV